MAVLRGQRNQCPGCGELFNSNKAFDKHRVGKFGDQWQGTPEGRRCLSVAEMLDKKMVQLPDGFWVTELWVKPAQWTSGMSTTATQTT